MKSKLLFITFFFYLLGFSQEVRNSEDIKSKTSQYTFAKIDISVPIRANQYAGEVDPYSGEKEPWFLPDGLSGRFAFGLKPNHWLKIGANLGVDWKGSECLVVVPVFGSFKINPKINDNLCVFVEPGFGRAFVIGNNQLSGYFKKISFGISDGQDNVGLYVELCEYGFNKNYDKKIGSLSLGLTFRL